MRTGSPPAAAPAPSRFRGRWWPPGPQFPYGLELLEFAFNTEEKGHPQARRFEPWVSYSIAIAGYKGIICGFSAIYTGLARVLKELYGRKIWPLGAVQPKSVEAPALQSVTGGPELAKAS